jgi:hypothetical protein
MNRIEMFKSTTTVSLLAASFAIATTAFAQAPTDAQREAIKSDCRSDYIAHCSSIPPGGAASLQCLQKNMANLSGACATAVRAVEAPAETKAEPATAPKEEPKQETKTEPAPVGEPAKPAPAAAVPSANTSTKAASTTQGKPSSAQIAAIRTGCRSDYPKVCAGVPAGGAAALECLEKNKAKLSAGCEKAIAAAGAGSAAPAAVGAAPATANASPTAAPAAAAPLPRLVLRPMRPREKLFVLRSACAADVRSLCAGVAAGGGRIMQCLATQSASLSPECRSVLGQFAAQ